MKRRKLKGVTVLAAALLVIALLSACGDSESGDAGGQTSAGTNPASNSGSNDSQATGTQKPAGKSDGAGGGNSNGNTPGSVIARPAEASEQIRNVKTGPLRISGGGSAQFRQPDDPNVIQDFGKEGSRSELKEAAIAVHGFFTAIAKADWSTACSYLSEGMLIELETLASHFGRLAGKPCPETVSTFAEKIPPRKAYELSEVDALSFRTQYEQGFLIYRRANVPVRTSLEKENGVWKVSSVFGTPVISQNSPPPRS